MTSAASSSSAVRPRPATVKNAPERSPADQSLPGGEMTEVPLFEIGMAPRKGGERAQSGSPRRRGGAGGGGGRQQAHSSPIMQTRSRARARRGHSSDDNDENDIDVEV
ncbi:hypothetical protein M406DRAFT_357363 [Cryphonectria parasitica EP155]|uniref:Uncharacterized protein n=1 Tax=Cryphonectria parasitica (strain ATCC 38755 / EP155) TaxID=660469 RepID=A0A9P5CKL2_CRYP1|nr:uncharacterized protein M406DRAFT_357363 [Cryphonectria parasitica EP155]KAF3762183.1 hypothetical protein M406DRAFT_357363 [Cryphonectria parasitica EP155]